MCPPGLHLVLRGGFLEDGEEFTGTALAHVGWSVACVRVRFAVVQDEVGVGREGLAGLGPPLAFLPWPHDSRKPLAPLTLSHLSHLVP